MGEYPFNLRPLMRVGLGKEVSLIRTSFFDLGPDRHGRVRCQPPIIRPLS